MLETPTLMCVHKYKEHIVYTCMWIPESTLIVFLDFNNFDRLAGKQDQGTPYFCLWKSEITGLFMWLCLLMEVLKIRSQVPTIMQ